MGQASASLCAEPDFKLAIPVKLNAPSEGKPNGIPG
jgi:hypothetical protein